MTLQILLDGANRQMPQEETIWNNKRENSETEGIEVFQYQGDRNCNKEQHQAIEESTGRIVLAPPVISFSRTDNHRLTLDSNVHLRSLAPKCLQIVNTSHLVRSIVQPLKSDFTLGGSYEIGK